MVLEPVECPVCGGTNVIKHGKSGEGKQRYLCQDSDYISKSKQPFCQVYGCYSDKRVNNADSYELYADGTHFWANT
jgi:transposase-like protein